MTGVVVGSVTGSAEFPTISEFSARDELTALREMLLVRRFEEKAGQLYAIGDIGGDCELSIGQEAVVVGLTMAARIGDQVVTGRRNHAQLLCAGAPASAILAELMGRASGLCAGKSGSSHMAVPEQGVYGGQAVAGSAVAIGAGIALANRHRAPGRVCWAYVASSATSSAQVGEALEIAAAWRLPLVVVIENSDLSGSLAARSGEPTVLAARGAAHGIPGEVVDGMDVRAVRAAGLRAADHARSGAGPFLLEARTFRYRGHAAPPPGQTEARRSRELSDPIERSKARIQREGLTSPEDLRAIDREVRDIVAGACRDAQSGAEPEAAELRVGVVR